MPHKFFFAGQIFTVNADSADVVDSHGYVVGNVAEIIDDMLDFQEQTTVESPLTTQSRKPAIFKQKSSVEAKLKRIEEITGRATRRRRRML